MRNSVWKITLAVLLLAVVLAFIYRSTRPLERYRERREFAGEAVMIDVCLEKGADSKKAMLSLVEAWQILQDLHAFPIPDAASKRAHKLSQRLNMLPGQNIVRGYYIDEAVKRIRKNGYDNFLIDAGTDVFASGRNCSRQPWMLAVRDFQDKKRIIDIIQVKNAAVSMFPSNKIGGGVTVIGPSMLESNMAAGAVLTTDFQLGISKVEKLGKLFAAMVSAKDKSGQLRTYPGLNYKRYQIKKHSR